jgi:alcohol dehydrogenase (cytochrome c)
MLWKQHMHSPMFGGALVTAGGVVFAGQMEGELDAFDEMTGKKLWSVKTPSSINAPPMTYSVDGKQYISVEVGLGGVLPLFFMASVPWLKTVKPASLVYTYALPTAAAAK